MILDEEVVELVIEICDSFRFSYPDVCSIISDVHDFEKPKDILELRKAVFQYAQRLTNS